MLLDLRSLTEGDSLSATFVQVSGSELTADQNDSLLVADQDGSQLYGDTPQPGWLAQAAETFATVASFLQVAATWDATDAEGFDAAATWLQAAATWAAAVSEAIASTATWAQDPAVWAASAAESFVATAVWVQSAASWDATASTTVPNADFTASWVQAAASWSATDAQPADPGGAHVWVPIQRLTPDYLVITAAFSQTLARWAADMDVYDDPFVFSLSDEAILELV